MAYRQEHSPAIDIHDCVGMYTDVVALVMILNDNYIYQLYNGYLPAYTTGIYRYPISLSNSDLNMVRCDHRDTSKYEYELK